ncbi:hypothetical protein [Spirillospora sp. NPDC047279]|uniref:hypothetical protein n=1 Tax=Spirillospora sp. NPDC047279 TaxID=3155478 RepID=UPI0033D0E01B
MRPSGAPLAGLDDVAWGRLHHAYGAATDVPGQLRALISPDEDERLQAYRELSGNVYHQGTRWQASGQVIPFLAALADDPATPERERVIGLLSALAVGDRDDTHLPFDPAKAFAAAAGVTAADVARTLNLLYGADDLHGEGGPCGEDGAEAAVDVDAVAVSWDRDAYRAAAAISDRFVSWTTDADQVVAARAAELLVWFPATGPAVSALLDVPGTDGRELARASANLTLGHLGADDPAIERRLTGLLAAGVYGVRLTAAVALALRQGERIPEAALEALVEARDRADEIHTGAFPLPWNRSLLGFSALALHRIGLAP